MTSYSVKDFLETTDLSSLKVDYSAPQALVTFLEATPAVLHTLLLTTARERWARRPKPGEWSIVEILCHLRDVDLEVNLPRVEAILGEENAFITGQSTDQWADERQYAQQDPDRALADFVAARAKLVKRLSGLELPDWERHARHTFLGPTTLRELTEIMVDHDRLHMKQAAEAVIK